MRTHTHICIRAHTCKTDKADCLQSPENLLKVSTSNFYFAHTHTCACSSYFTRKLFSQSRFASLFRCCLLFISQITSCDPLALFFLLLLKENPHPAILSAEGCRCTNCLKIIELLKQAVNTPEELALQDEHVLIIIPQEILD